MKFSERTKAALIAKKMNAVWHPMKNLNYADERYPKLKAYFGNNQYVAVLREEETKDGPVTMLGIQATNEKRHNETTTETKRRILQECLGAVDAYEIYQFEQTETSRGYFWLMVVPAGEGLGFKL
jgi:hypothetical protein